MKIFYCLDLLLIMCFAGSPCAFAQYSTSFENPPYSSSGGSVLGVDSWTGNSTSEFTSSSAYPTSSGMQSLKIANSVAARNLTRDITSTKNLNSFTVDFMDSGFSSNYRTFWIYITTKDSSGNDSGLGQIALSYGTNTSNYYQIMCDNYDNNDIRVAGGATVLKPPNTWVPGEWNNVQFVFDFSSHQYDILINGIKVVTGAQWHSQAVGIKSVKLVSSSTTGMGPLYLDNLNVSDELEIDPFQYSTATAAQDNWTAYSAGQAAVPVFDVPCCLALENIFTTSTVRGYWDRDVLLDISGHEKVAIRLKSTRHLYMTLYFQTTAGGWYTKYFTIREKDKWLSYVFSLDSFGVEGTVNGWDNIKRIRIACWQEDDTTPATVHISDLRASNNGNLLLNSGFETVTSEAIPDCWGPTEEWGISSSWTTDMDSWRSLWKTDDTVNHTPGGGRSLKITSSTPLASDLKAFPNWVQLEANTTYVLSAWLRSDQANFPVYMGVKCSPAAGTTLTTSSTPNTWQRYTLSFTPTSSSDIISCWIYPTGDGNLWIDDVQLEEGTVANDWQAALLDANIEKQTVHKNVPLLDDETIVPGANSVTVSIDAYNRFLVDGSPFIPVAIGWERGIPSSDILHHFALAGFNTVVPLLNSTHTVANILDFLDDAKAEGLKVIIWAHSNISTTTLASWVNGLKSHPAVIMWYVYDEPDTTAEWQDAEDKYDIAKANDPSRPAMVNVYAHYSDVSSDWSSDVLSTDYYPINFPGCSIGGFAEIIDTMYQTALTAGKPAWCWLQSSGYAFFCSREPTGAEAECIAYLAVIHGMRGFMYFSQMPKTEEQWNEMRMFAKEISILTPVLSSTETAPPAQSAASSLIHTLRLHYDGYDYVIAVNESPDPVTTDLMVRGSNPATVLFETIDNPRTISRVNGSIIDTFDGYQRHVYKIQY